MGDIRNALGQKGVALQEYRRALAGFRQAGVPEGIVEALNNLGAMHQALQEYQPAREAYQEAMSLCAQTPRRLVQQGTTFNNLGRLAYIQGERARGAEDPAQARAAFREALSSYEQALAWFRADGLVNEETIALNNLGDACRALGASERARTTYWQALRRFQEQGDRRGEGLSLNNLGQLYHDLASQPGKQAYLEEERRCSIAALRLFRETGDRWQERIALRNLGRFYPIYQALEAGQRYQYALACLVLAGKIATELGLLQETPIPTWVEQTVRHWLRQTDGISYGTFVRDIEQRAAEIIEEILQSGR
jgi:tetratricopeptide (TPR) repeat protein